MPRHSTKAFPCRWIFRNKKKLVCRCAQVDPRTRSRHREGGQRNNPKRPRHADRKTSHVFFSHAPCTSDHTHIVAQGVSVRISLHPHAIHDVTCLSLRLLSLRVCLFPVSHPLLLFLCRSLPVLSGTPSSMSSPPRVKTTALTHNEEYCPVAIYNLLTGYEPNVIDNFDCSKTFSAIFQNESVDIDTEPSYSCDAEVGDEIIGEVLPPPLFIQEREEPANRRQAYHSHEESLLPARSFFAHKYGETRNTNLVRAKNENQVAKRRTKESGFSLKDKKSKFSLKSEPRSRSTNFKPILIVSRN